MADKKKTRPAYQSQAIDLFLRYQEVHKAGSTERQILIRFMSDLYGKSPEEFRETVNREIDRRNAAILEARNKAA